MNDRVAYLERSDRGASVRGVRLVGPHDEDRWENLAAGGEPDPAAAASRAAGWIADKLAEKRGKSLAMLCIDADGSVCSWVSASSPEERVVASLARAHAGAGDESGSETPLAFFAPADAESRVQALDQPRAAPARRWIPSRGKAPPEPPRRMGVLASADLAARLVIDALDASGIAVDSATSIWHLLAAAWDPSARQKPPAGDPGALTQAGPLTAVVLVEGPDRLIWSWSDAGALVAAGSIRLDGKPSARVGDEGEAPETRSPLGEHHVARLASEWLGWSLQVGRGPGRVICVVPPVAAGVRTADGEEPVGARLARVWPQASVDAAVMEDPIGATLRRALAAEPDPVALGGDPRTGLVALSHRPARAHRRLYQWSALAIGVGAAALAAAAWRIDARAASASEAAATMRQEIRQTIEQVYPPAMIAPGGPVLELQKRVSELESKFSAKAPDPPMPILQEIEALSNVLGSDMIELEELGVAGLSIVVIVRVPDLATFELLRDALPEVSGSQAVNWTSTQVGGAGGEGLRYQLTASWSDEAKKGAGGGR